MFSFFKRFKKPKAAPIITPKPAHVAVIMDGNGRWANARGLSRVAGHKRGADAVKRLVKSCLEHEIPYLSLFAFSSENWNRPPAEVNALMDLLLNVLSTQTKKLSENGVRLKIIGDLSELSPKIQKKAQEAMQETHQNNSLTLTVAINYGGRWDIVNAARTLVDDVLANKISSDDIDETAFASRLSTHGLPDPDLFIRTSGEYRISNFMLWQGAYSEFYFVDTLWPDFDAEAFTDALHKYTNRDRRFGGAKDSPSSLSGDSKSL